MNYKELRGDREVVRAGAPAESRLRVTRKGVLPSCLFFRPRSAANS